MTETKKIYKTTWKVMDEEGNIWFEGYYGEAENFIKEKKLENVKLVPFMEIVG